MRDGFDIKKGIFKVLRKAVATEEFSTLVINLLLGRKNAAEDLKRLLLSLSYEESLNEVVVMHRALKPRIDEDFTPNNDKDKNLLRKIYSLPKKSWEFQTEVVTETLKKPGAVMALLRLIASDGTDPKAWSVLAPALVDSAYEVMNGGEDELNEAFDPDAQKVSLYVGRFQPFTLAHLAGLRESKAFKDFSKALDEGMKTFLG